MFSIQPADAEAALKCATLMPCILCGTAPAGISALWFPGNDLDRRLVGTPPGKTRAVLYSLCDRCHAKSGALERVEDVIRAGIAVKC